MSDQFAFALLICAVFAALLQLTVCLFVLGTGRVAMVRRAAAAVHSGRSAHDWLLENHQTRRVLSCRYFCFGDIGATLKRCLHASFLWLIEQARILRTRAANRNLAMTTAAMAAQLLAPAPLRLAIRVCLEDVLARFDAFAHSRF